MLILNGGTKPVHFNGLDGPDTVNPHAGWWEQFFEAGGGAFIDRFQVHESVGLDAPAAWTLALWLPLLAEHEPHLLEGLWIGESGPLDHDGMTNVSDLSAWTLDHYAALPAEVEFAAVCASERLSAHADVLDAVAQLND